MAVRRETVTRYISTDTGKVLIEVNKIGDDYRYDCVVSKCDYDTLIELASAIQFIRDSDQE